MTPAMRSSITVLGPDVMGAPLLETSDARIVEFRDSFGDLNALLIRVLSDEMWGLVTKQDPDWFDTLIRHGYMRPGGSSMDLLRSGRRR